MLTLDRLLEIFKHKTYNKLHGWFKLLANYHDRPIYISYTSIWTEIKHQSLARPSFIQKIYNLFIKVQNYTFTMYKSRIGYQSTLKVSKTCFLKDLVTLRRLLNLLSTKTKPTPWKNKIYSIYHLAT